MMKLRRWQKRQWRLVASVCLIVTMLIGSTFLRSPLVLYPASSSLPEVPYLRTFGPIEKGKIAAFPMPMPARLYQARLGHDVPDSFMLMKPVKAGPGDHVCNSVHDGLAVNGQWLAETAAHDGSGNPLPVWTGCDTLGDGQFFLFSDHTPKSFDSRYFGPVDGADIVGVYQPLF